MVDILFPLIVLCGLFAVVILAGIGYTYFWLSWFYSQAIKCPRCGRRWAGEIVESNVTDSSSDVEWQDVPKVVGLPSRRLKVRVTKETFDDHFICKYCGHEWTKTGRAKMETPMDEQ